MKGILVLFLFLINGIVSKGYCKDSISLSATFAIDHQIAGIDVYSSEMKSMISDTIYKLSNEVFSESKDFIADPNHKNQKLNRIKINFYNINNFTGSISGNNSFSCHFENILELHSCLKKY